MSKMNEALIDKVTVNMGVGQPGEELEKAIEILQLITGAKPVKTKAKIKQPGWGIREGLTIGAKVTLRKEKAKDFLKRALEAKEKKLNEKNFDRSGNFGFGIREYIDLPGIKYDPSKGIRGFDVLVTLKKPGYRIKIRKINKKKIPARHRVTKEDAIEFMKKNFGVEIK